MTLKLRWTNRALVRLDSINAHIAEDNSVRADRFAKELRAKVEN